MRIQELYAKKVTNGKEIEKDKYQGSSLARLDKIQDGTPGMASLSSKDTSNSYGSCSGPLSKHNPYSCSSKSWCIINTFPP
jgi:hypothetical protein